MVLDSDWDRRVTVIMATQSPQRSKASDSMNATIVGEHCLEHSSAWSRCVIAIGWVYIRSGSERRLMTDRYKDPPLGIMTNRYFLVGRKERLGLDLKFLMTM